MANAAREEKYSYVDDWKSLWEPDLEAIGYNGITTDPTKVDPKVLQWVKTNCAHKPHFVKIINPSAAHGRPGISSRNSTFLYVPVPFVREHFKELGRVITLENEDGRTWKVSFGSAARRYPTWTQGWARVAKDSNLKPGDVIVFVLVRDSRFHFTVFDEEGNRIGTEKSSSTQINNAVVKKEPSCSSHSHHQVTSPGNNPDLVEHPKTRKRLFESPGSPSPATHHQIAQPKQQNSGENFEVGCQTAKLPTSPSMKTVKTTTSTKEKCKLCRARSGDSQQSSPVPTVLGYDANPSFESIDPFAFSIKSRRRVTTALERQTAEDAAMAYAKSLTRPHFVSVMSETQVYRDFQLVLPDAFVAESSFPTVTTQWRLHDCTGNAWEMYSMESTTRNEITLQRKFWAPFSVHHLLEDGDVCVFEKNEPLAVRVHIFRVVPISTDDMPISVHAHYDMRELD